jgi:hypothetical protein
LRHMIDRLEVRTAEATELRIRLELTERTESTLQESSTKNAGTARRPNASVTSCAGGWRAPNSRDNRPRLRPRHIKRKPA